MIYIEIDYRMYAAVIVITIKEINSSVNDQSFHFVLTLRFMKSHSSSISILLCKLNFRMPCIRLFKICTKYNTNYKCF